MIKEQPNIRPMASYGRNEVAKLLEVSPRSVANYVNRGLLPIGGMTATSRYFYYGKDIVSCWKKLSFGK